MYATNDAGELLFFYEVDPEGNPVLGGRMGGFTGALAAEDYRVWGAAKERSARKAATIATREPPKRVPMTARDVARANALPLMRLFRLGDREIVIRWEDKDPAFWKIYAEVIEGHEAKTNVGLHCKLLPMGKRVVELRRFIRLTLDALSSEYARKHGYHRVGTIAWHRFF